MNGNIQIERINEKGKGKNNFAKLKKEDKPELNSINKVKLGYQLIGFSQRGNLEKVKELIEKGASVNEMDGKGQTALMWAAIYGHTEISQMLIEKGADLNVRDVDGNTALMYVAWHGHTDISKLLIENGANVNTQNIDEDDTAIILAAENGHTEIVDLLIENGAKVPLSCIFRVGLKRYLKQLKRKN